MFVANHTHPTPEDGKPLAAITLEAYAREVFARPHRTADRALATTTAIGQSGAMASRADIGRTLLATSLVVAGMACGGSTSLQGEHESQLACGIVTDYVLHTSFTGLLPLTPRYIAAIDEALGDAQAAARGSKQYVSLRDTMASLDNAVHRHDEGGVAKAAGAAVTVCQAEQPHTA